MLDKLEAEGIIKPGENILARERIRRAMDAGRNQ
jgi:hypothetical protein